ncbi:hypothetical protein Syun_019265 [Stephania yunnanensis]|uniref:Protein kinase domain-containing protein n=1 Tax=Stephania yunnanensis TaxID=152371 RepID=A0AAP0ITS8_9MAGN
MLNRGHDGSISDVWSCTVMLYALLTSSLHFDNQNLEVLYQKLIMMRMMQLNIGPKRLVRLIVSVLITLIHLSHYLVKLNKSHGNSSLYRQDQFGAQTPPLRQGGSSHSRPCKSRLRLNIVPANLASASISPSSPTIPPPPPPKYGSSSSDVWLFLLRLWSVSHLLTQYRPCKSRLFF